MTKTKQKGQLSGQLNLFDDMPKAKKLRKKHRQNPFNGADDVYLTKRKIAVVKTKRIRLVRGYRVIRQKKFYVQNAKNLKDLKSARGGSVRIGRKGNKVKEL